MIYSIYAKVTIINDCEVILDIGNICLSCFIPNPQRLHINNLYTFKTYLSWNNDHGPSLYGFIDLTEYTMFCLLLSCSGIGPKMALSILHTIPLSIIHDAIASQKPKILTDAPGIGLKKAEHIIVELKNKIEKIVFESSINHEQDEKYKDLTATLEHLGYTQAQIHIAIKDIHQTEHIKNQPLVNLIRHAISII